MNKFIDRLLTNFYRSRLLKVVFTLALLALGYWSFATLETEAYPEFTDPTVRVITQMPGKGAEEVERLVTIPLEKQLNGIPGETGGRSISFLGLSVIETKFEDGTPILQARQQVLERIAQADIPSNVKPSLNPDSGAVGEIYRYTVESKEYSPMELKAIEDWTLENAFKQIPGVIDVTSWGGSTKTYQVKVDPSLLSALHVTLDQVYQALSNSNATTGANYIENNGQAYIVRGVGLLKNIDDINRVVVTTTQAPQGGTPGTIQTPAGTPIRIQDVATVETGSGERLGHFAKNDDENAVMGIVLMRRGENPSRVLDRLYQKFPEIQAALPKGVQLVPLYDRNQLVHETLDTIAHNVIEGVVLVVTVLIVFLFDVTSGLVTATVIPLALLFAFICLKILHVPANLLSLGAIDFGIIVDGSVVMVENAFRRLAEEGHDCNQSGRKELVLESAKQVGRPILFATVIIIICFLPIFAFPGVAGKLFRPLAITMTSALVGAAVVSLTIIPALVSLFMTRRPLIERESPVIGFARRLYQPVLTWSLKYPLPVLSGAIASLVLAVILFFNTGSEFLPPLDEGNIWLRVTVAPTSISLEEAKGISHRVRSIMMHYPEVKNVTSQIGSPDDGTDPNLFSDIEFLVDLLPADQWRASFHHTKENIIAAMGHDLAVLPNITPAFSQYIQDNVDEAISGAKGELSLKIFGSDIQILQTLGDKAADIIRRVSGMEDVDAEQMLGQPQYQIVVDRDAAARYGINVSDIQTLVTTAVGGQAATQLIEGERRFDVIVRLSKPYRDSQSALENLLIDPPGPGGPIPVSQVAHVETTSGAAIIFRENNEHRLAVKANVRGRDLGSAVTEAQQKIGQQIKLPAGYRLKWAGQYEFQQESNQRLLIVVPLTLFIIFCILMLQFSAVRQCLMILVVVPLAAIGGTIGLFVTHTFFSISAGVGFIALFGVAVQNGIILVSYINQLRRRARKVPRTLRAPVDLDKESLYEKKIHEEEMYREEMDEEDLHEEENQVITTAVYEGALTRMRPVLMTATVAILGLLPAATSNGIGSQSQKPFAIVIISGLISATFLTLLVLPTLYNLVEQHGKAVSRRASKRKLVVPL